VVLAFSTEVHDCTVPVPKRKRMRIGSPWIGGAVALVLALFGALAGARPAGFQPLDAPVLDRVVSETGFRPGVLERPCRAGPDGRCAARAVDSLATALRTPDETVRLVVLGDSHVASDYITGMARHRLQARYGNAGRGLVAPDRSHRYGGRRTSRTVGWRKERIVDAGQAGKSFGLTGLVLESACGGARVVYRVRPDDRFAEIFFEGHPRGPEVEVRTGTVSVRLGTAAPSRRVAVWRIPVEGHDRLVVRALGAGVRLFGVAFETGRPGVILEAMGPVGAESQVYLQMDRQSFLEHLRLRRPDAILTMLGGNDALKVRKGWWTLDRVERQFRELLRVVQDGLPGVECIVLTPMDAGRRREERVVSRAMIPEVAEILRRVALEQGCAVWDLLAAMGGPGSISRWVRAGVINPEDLLHPRKAAADVIGRGLAQVLVDAVETATTAPAAPR